MSDVSATGAADLEPGRDRCSELGQFFRLRRERITPAEVGLASGQRRRSAGLRRAEVAVLAGLSTSWYTFLEQGRDVLPSRAALDSLARVLRMTEDERLYIHSLAYGQDGAPALVTPLEPKELISQIIGIWDSHPYPVYGCNQYFDVIGWNRANADWYCDWGAVPEADRNIMNWVLTAPAARHRLVDWADIAGDVVARWRSHCTRNPDDAISVQRTERLLDISPEFAEGWASHRVLEHRTGIRRIRHEVLGQQLLRIVPILSPELGSCGIVLHLPVTPAP